MSLSGIVETESAAEMPRLGNVEPAGTEPPPKNLAFFVQCEIECLETVFLASKPRKRRDLAEPSLPSLLARSLDERDAQLGPT